MFMFYLMNSKAASWGSCSGLKLSPLAASHAASAPAVSDKANLARATLHNNQALSAIIEKPALTSMFLAGLDSVRSIDGTEPRPSHNTSV
ncbi:hypothetical protein [Variovorax sp. RA8]|uniref:hypothetical protein n=1 Tax=Variovorax sp. (strain JCM 16519 / RA8) TaxID=662548 RepID=UPI0013A5946C|nr:hypothetical protein [Variovorax sp. RA8]